MRATQVTQTLSNQPKHRHHPACPGDPFCFWGEGNWVARTSRAMTIDRMG
jgi:hypothetical protein